MSEPPRAAHDDAPRPAPPVAPARPATPAPPGAPVLTAIPEVPGAPAISATPPLPGTPAPPVASVLPAAPALPVAPALPDSPAPPVASARPDAPVPAGAPTQDEAVASHVLRLYVAGTTARSARAVATARRILEDRLPGRYSLAVVDIYQDPEAARVHQIVAVPTLIRLRPLPLRRLIGDLSDQARVLAALGLDADPSP